MALLIPSRQIVLFDYVRGAADNSRNAPTEAWEKHLSSQKER